VSDQTFEQIAQGEPARIRGTVKMVTENFVRTAHNVGLSGWKDHAMLRGFSGDAYLSEMGITDPDDPKEVSECALNEPYGFTLDAGELLRIPPMQTEGRTSTASRT